MIDYQSLAAVAAVVREGAFDRAAGVLGITPSAVSQRVRGLEERMGAVLVVRGQPCVATDIGRALVAHFDRVRLLEADLAPILGGGPDLREPPPTLKIAVNADSLATWFPAAAAAFARVSGASLDLAVEDEGFTSDRLRSGEVLAAVTADPGAVPGCRTVSLGALCYVAAASPGFVVRHFAGGVDPAALATAPHLRFDRRDRLQSGWAARAHGTDLGGPAHRVPSTHGFLDAALAGLAWGMHPVVLAQPHLDAGRLVELEPRLRIDVDLYWTVSRLAATSIRQMTAAVRAAAGAVLDARPTRSGRAGAVDVRRRRVDTAGRMPPESAG